MKHITNLNETLPMSACVAFGHFDGMHLGHQAVIEKFCSHLDLTPVLLSFAQTEKPVIYTEREKAVSYTHLIGVLYFAHQESNGHNGTIAHHRVGNGGGIEYHIRCLLYTSQLS